MRRGTIIATQKKKEYEATHKIVKMIRFIEQEAREKAEEVECKTAEECSILKGNLIQTERLKITGEYIQKEIHSKQKFSIDTSKFMQQQRMLIVQAKMQIFDEIAEDVKFQVFNDMESSKRRWNILQRLIMEALYKILEPRVVLKCREVDENMIKKALPDIETVYQNTTNHKITISIDDEYLSCCLVLPGVIIRTPNSKVSITNTMDNRLDQIMRSSLPVMNQIFYGTSKMRK